MRKLLLVGVIILVFCGLTFSADYIGVKKCKMCHKGEKKGEVFEKWEKSTHAKAFETLKKKTKR